MCPKFSDVYLFIYLFIWGFPGGAGGKDAACQCRRQKRCRFDPRVGKIPWSRKWQPDPILISGKFHGQRFLGGYCPWGHEESDTIEHTHKHSHSGGYILRLSTEGMGKNAHLSLFP